MDYNGQDVEEILLRDLKHLLLFLAIPILPNPHGQKIGMSLLPVVSHFFQYTRFRLTAARISSRVKK